MIAQAPRSKGETLRQLRHCAAELLEWSRTLPDHKLPLAEWCERRYDSTINRKGATMASLVTREGLAGTISVGMEGATDDYDVLEELAGWIANFESEMLQVSLTDGFVVIANAEPPPVDGDGDPA